MCVCMHILLVYIFIHMYHQMFLKWYRTRPTRLPISEGILPLSPQRHMHSLRRVVTRQSSTGMLPVNPTVAMIARYNSHTGHTNIFYNCKVYFLYVPGIVASSIILSCESLYMDGGSCPSIPLLDMTMEWTCEVSMPTYEHIQSRVQCCSNIYTQMCIHTHT